tara:strand:- start:4312 stop:5088 length:777 start_codon:yes stop_codon:yes gene_type:complete
MAIDFEAIKRKLDRLSGNNNSRNSMWKPVEGEKHTVRLLSFPDNDGQPFKELMFYYNIPGQRGLLAPSQFGKKDPIQELINKLRDEGTKESYDMAKKLYPKMRVYAACVVRGEESEGVRLWGFGKTVYQKLLALMLDEDYGDITDPTEGRDINVVCSKNPGQQWAMTEVTPRGRETKLASDSKQAKEWMKNLPDLENIFQLKSYDELSKIINDWLADGDEDDTGTEHGSTTEATEATKSKDKSGSYGSLDDAFADLMD